MVATPDIETPEMTRPRTLAEFIDWEPADGFKYEWNDGELIRFTGMKKKEYAIFARLGRLLAEKGYFTLGTLISEPDVMLTGIQMRRPDIAYFSNEQLVQSEVGIDVIPEFVVELISPTDDVEQFEKKIVEYFKAGVRVLWKVLPTARVVYVYTGRKTVHIVTDADLCSASPVSPDFALSVNDLFAKPIMPPVPVQPEL